MNEFPRAEGIPNQDNERERQLKLFSIWLDSVKKGEKRKEYKIPPRITELSCGCKRERGNEVDMTNTWHVAKNKDNEYYHTECMKAL